MRRGKKVPPTDQRARVTEILKSYFPRASANGKEQQDRPTNNKAREKQSICTKQMK